MVKRLKIEWAESADELEARYKMEKQVERRTRLLALRHLRQGKQIEEVVQVLSVSYRSVQNWLSWYRQGGLEEVLRRVGGHGSSGAHSAYLTPLQQRALFAKVQWGAFRTVQARWGVGYTYKGMHDLLYRHECAPKVPRPQSSTADPQRQEQWKKGA